MRLAKHELISRIRETIWHAVYDCAREILDDLKKENPSLWQEIVRFVRWKGRWALSKAELFDRYPILEERAREMAEVLTTHTTDCLLILLCFHEKVDEEEWLSDVARDIAREYSERLDRSFEWFVGELATAIAKDLIEDAIVELLLTE